MIPNKCLKVCMFDVSKFFSYVIEQESQIYSMPQEEWMSLNFQTKNNPLKKLGISKLFSKSIIFLKFKTFRWVGLQVSYSNQSHDLIKPSKTVLPSVSERVLIIVFNLTKRCLHKALFTRDILPHDVSCDVGLMKNFLIKLINVTDHQFKGAFG